MAKNWEAEHNARTVLYSKQVETIYAAACQEAANIGATITGFNADKPFSFSDYPLTQHRIEKLTSGLGSSVNAVIVNGITAEWTESNFKSDELAKSILGYAYKGKDFKKVAQYQKYFNNNHEALAAFIARKDAGLALSDKVWFYTSKFKNEIELGLDLGLRSGKSAADMARDLKQYLKEPDKLFRRVKDQHGILHLSKAAKNYNPGQGVYRSSYKNALRLSITETNMAYRAAEHERLQQLDFIVGIEVQVSKNNHPVNDICDNLKGLYPKDFKFVGWHPHCRCHTISILKTDKEILADDKLIAAGGEPTTESTNKVDTPPAGWGDWLAANKDRIAAAKDKGTLPYFLKDNPVYSGIKKTPAAAPAPKVLTPAEIKAAENMAYEKTYGAKKLAEAEKYGVSGVNYDKLVAALSDESATYSKLANLSNNLVQDIKTAKDPLAKIALEKKYSKEQVDNLFGALDAFKGKYAADTLETKIKKYTFEIEYVLKANKFSTSKEFAALLQKDLDVLIIQQEHKSATSFALDYYLTKMASPKSSEVNALLKKLAKEIDNPKATEVILKAKVAEIDQLLKKQLEKEAELLEKKLAKQKLGSVKFKDADFTNERKDNALWSDDVYLVDKKVRDICGAVWRISSKAERKAIYTYTDGSSYVNEPLRKMKYTGQYVGVREGERDAKLIAGMIDKSTYDFDMWIQRGVDGNGLDGLMGLSDLQYKTQDELTQLLVGKIVDEHAFSSCGVAKGKGFTNKKVIYNIYCPKGTKMMYLEPFSEYGGSGAKTAWDGLTTQTDIRSEAEMLLQRGTKFRILKVEVNGNKIYIDKEIIGQL